MRRLWRSFEVSDHQNEWRFEHSTQTVLASRVLRGHSEGVSCMRFLAEPAGGAAGQRRSIHWQVQTATRGTPIPNCGGIRACPCLSISCWNKAACVVDN